MNIIGMNRKVVALLEQWDPFEKGPKAYQSEITDVVQALHQIDYPADLAKKIREIYERTSQLWIPIEKCVHIAYKLLAVKYEANSIV